MSRYVIAGAIAVTIGAVAFASVPAEAQQRLRCPGNEGRTASGECINPGLAASLRHRSVHMNQVMINQWIYPFPPLLDGTFPRGFDVNRVETSVEGTGSTSPFPPSP